MVRTNTAIRALVFALAGCSVGGCDDSPQRSYSGESVFEMFSPPTPQDAARWAADPYDADLRLRGTLLLANAPWGGEKPYLDMYELAAKDGNPAVRSAALRSLARHGMPEHAALMIEALSDPNEQVRWEGARALQRFYAPQSVTPLIERTNPDRESMSGVRGSAAWALGQYGEPRVVQALIASLSERNLSVNESALASLKTLTGQDFGYDAKRWLAWTREAGTAMFAGGTAYSYRIFERDHFWYEWLPFVPPPPNETAGLPIGAVASEPTPPPTKGE